MCLMCETDDLDDIKEKPMADPWDALKDEILATLKDGVDDFKGDLKDAAKAFLENQAKQIAKQKWRHLKATSQEDAEIAESNLRHLAGQSRAEIARLGLASTREAASLLERVLKTVISFVVKLSPALLA